MVARMVVCSLQGEVDGRPVDRKSFTSERGRPIESDVITRCGKVSVDRMAVLAQFASSAARLGYNPLYHVWPVSVAIGPAAASCSIHQGVPVPELGHPHFLRGRRLFVSEDVLLHNPHGKADAIDYLVPIWIAVLSGIGAKIDGLRLGAARIFRAFADVKALSRITPVVRVDESLYHSQQLHEIYHAL